jgi:hypothetical protein
MKEKNDKSEIKWNTKKHDEKSLEREQEKAKVLIGKMYESFKAELCSKSRKHSEITQALVKFRDDVLKQAKYLAENKLEGFSMMTVDIIEKKIADMITARITAQNRITQHIPVTGAAQGVKSKSAPFKNKEDLLKIPFVDHFTKQPGFSGFAWKRNEARTKIEFLLMAEYVTGDKWLVGSCVSDIGLEDIPEFSEDEPTKQGDAPCSNN